MKITVLLLFLCLSVKLLAQDDDSIESTEFADFRKELQGEYDDFRKEINAEYVDFLSKAWKEYRLFQGKTPDEMPKPLSPVLFQEEKNDRDIMVAVDGIIDKPIDEVSTMGRAEAGDTPWKTDDSLRLDYFGARLRLRYQNRPFLLPAITEQSVGNFWKEVAGSHYSPLLSDMLRYKTEMQMNDWAYFLLTEKVATRLSALRSEDCRTVFQHFLLVQAGYDVRLARIDRFLVLLLPVREEVYARSYLEIDGKQYYVISKKNLKSYSNIYTYQLPEKLIERPYVSLMIHKELLLPMQPVAFSVKVAGIEVKGEVNINKIRFYKEYPLCELSVYAQAPVDSRLSRQLVTSLSAQLVGKSSVETLNILLSWVQKGFSYLTDGKQFGYEKPFFIEENFYYPATDCEDRSILFAFLVRNLLKKKVVLLDYPGHVATAVRMDSEVKGNYILLDGEKYIVCDPTYMNAEAGRVIPACRKKRPKVIRLEL